MMGDDGVPQLNPFSQNGPYLFPDPQNAESVFFLERMRSFRLEMK